MQGKQNKRGSVTDLPFLMIGIFTFAVVVICVSLVVYHLNNEIQENSVFDDSSKSASQMMADDFPAVVNGAILFIFFGLAIVSLVLASLVPIHPAFMIFYIFELIILIWLGGGIANAYQVFISTEALAPMVDKFVLTTFFFQYFPFVIGVIGSVLAIVMYKARSALWG